MAALHLLISSLRLIRVQSIRPMKFLFDDSVKTLSVASYHMQGDISALEQT